MKPAYDLAVNLPLRAEVAARLRDTLRGMAVDEAMLGYPAPAGAPEVLDAIAMWMRRHTGHDLLDGRRLVLTLGARQALSLAVDETCTEGDTLLVEELTYHGFRAAIEARGMRTLPVAMDDEGLRPDALDETIRASGARTLYVQPTLHNPTTCTLSRQRRHDIAEVASRHDVTVIEGDVYSPLTNSGADRLPPLSALLPGRCLHAGGIGKVLGPGLRVGWLLLPDDEQRERVAASIARTTDGLPSLLPTLVARWITDGTADTLLTHLRRQLVERNALADALFDGHLVTAGGLHAWLPCRDTDALGRTLGEAGIRTTLGRRHANAPAEGIRLSLAAEEDIERLATALHAVATAAGIRPSLVP